MNWFLNNIQVSPTTYNETILGTAYTGIHYYTATGVAGNFSYGDIQQTIYQLLGDGWSSNVFLGSSDQTRVSALIAGAVTHDGYIPDAGEKISVILDPGANQQPIIIETLAAKLGDFVWNDTNHDGTQDDGEPGIAGATVNLVRDLNGNGIIETSEVLATTTTADGTGILPLGYYEFKGLTPGLDYQVQFVMPTGFDALSPRQVADGTVGNNSDGLLSDVVVLLPGQFNDTIDSGFYKTPQPTASLGDRLWMDNNGDGIQNDGATGISGQTITLIGGGADGLISTTGDNTTATTITGFDGFYQFTGLTPGVQYQVQFSKPAGTVYSLQDVSGNTLDSTDSDANAAGLSQIVTLASGEYNPTIDAGVFTPASDLSITKTDGLTCVTPGQTVTYAIVVSNSGPATATNALVSDIFPSTLTNVSWTSVAAGGASGNDLSGTGNINDFVTLIGGSTITYTVTGTVASGAALSKLCDFGAGVDNTNLGQSITINGVTADAFYINSGYQTTNTALWERDVTNDHGIGVWSNGEPDPIANGGDVNEISNQVNNEVIRLTKADGQSWTSLWVSSLDSGGSGSAEAGTLYWSNSATPDLSSLSTKFSFKYGDFGTSVKGDLLTLKPANFDPSSKYLFFVAGPNAAGTNNDYLFWKATTTATSLVNTASVTAPAGFTDSNPNDNSATDTDCINKVGIDVEKYVQGHYLAQCAGGGEGLTPGFWKTHSVCGPAPLAGWPETGYKSDGSDSYELIFGVNVPGTPTLLYALSTGGGGLNALMRQSAAALLNAADPYVDYFYTKAQIISMVQAAVASGDYETTKNLFEVQNQLGADLNTPAFGTATCWVDTPVYDADLLTDPHPIIPVGGQAIFTYIVKNTGDVALGNIQVTDDRISTLTFVGGDTNHNNMLDTTETWIYTARETVGAGVSHVNVGTATGVDSISGNQVSDSDAANYTTSPPTAFLGDRVWEDKNANGVQDLGEVGISGVTVQLKNSIGTTIATRLTDANGNYLFDVTPGTYSVAIVAPTGYMVSPKDQGSNDNIDSDIDPTSKMTAPMVISAGEQKLSVDAGLYRTAEIGDRVWCDTNKNGVQDAGEAGVKGVKVTLLDTAGMAVGSPLVTDANGNFLFTGLKPGTYSVQFDKTTLPAGYVFTTKDAAAVTDATDSDADPATGKTIQTVLDSGESDRSWDAGIMANSNSLKGSIGNRVWCDTNHNGIQDPGEAGISGVTVKLINSSGKVLGTTTTDDNGNYLFSNLNAGDYQVKVVQPSGYQYTKANIGMNDSMDSDVDATGKTPLTHLTAGESDLSWDAGLYKMSTSDATTAGIKLPSMADLLSGSSSLDSLLTGSTSPVAPANVTTNTGMDFDTSVLDAMKQLAHLYDQAAVHA